MKELRRNFALLPGGGQTAGAAKGQLAAVARPREEQLALASWQQPGAARRLLSIGFDALDFPSFQQVLKASGVRHVVDIRMLAAFRGRGFAPDIVGRTFRDLGVGYLRCRDLANIYASSSSNHHLVLKRYSAHLRENADGALSQVANLLLTGTVLLLGREAEHFGSDREVLVEQLAELHRPLELVVFHACLSVSVMTTSILFPQTEPSSMAVKAKARTPKKRSAKASARQLSFPDASRR